MADKALHRKRQTGHRDHHLKPGVKWNEPVPDNLFSIFTIFNPPICLLFLIFIARTARLVEDCCLKKSTEPNVPGG
jgi:hypothetical protein